MNEDDLRQMIGRVQQGRLSRRGLFRFAKAPLPEPL